jgi:PDZ domain-containing protein
MPPTTLGSDPLGWTPPLPLPRKRRHLWPVALVVLAALAVASVFVSLPYEVVSPGGANDLSGLVSIKGTPEFRAKGALLFVTVGVRDNVSPLQLLAAWVSPDRDFYRLPKSFSHKQEQVINTALMSNSKLLAEGVAISRAGPNAPKATGAEVSVVVPDRPAAAFLKVHDLIVAIDGKKVTATECAVGGIRAHKPGDKISVTFVRDGKLQTAEATLAAGPQNTPLLGVQLETKFATGFAVDINSGLVTGPSAGLAYALELLDLMTPGELTGGARVAATGELDTDGSGKVLPIGGEAEKAATVRSQHVAMFIVPRANYAKAKAHAGKLKVVPVDTIDDALRALATLPGSNAGQYLQAASPC